MDLKSRRVIEVFDMEVSAYSGQKKTMWNELIYTPKEV